MSRKVPKPQSIGHGWPDSWRELVKKLMATGSRCGRYRMDQFFSWMLEDVLRDCGVKIGADPPEEVKETLFDLSSTYGRCVVDSPLEDVLGPIYMQSGQGNSYMAQYFTPASVARCMAMVSMGSENPADRAEMLTMCEPCSGSGVLALNFADVYRLQFGPEALANISFTCIDLDPVCAKMTAAQFLANAVIHGFTYGELLVVHGNSLFPQKMWEPVVFATRREPAPVPARPHPHHPARKEAVAAAAASQPGLFDWHQAESA